MARKFLYVIAAIIALVFAAFLALRIWSEDLTALAFVPDADFQPGPALAVNAWDDPQMWVSRPGLEGEEDPARYLPKGATVIDEAPLDAAVFFVHPTSYIEKAAWNADIADPTAQERTAMFVRGMASPFNDAAEIWAPRYRQAAVGAFLTDKPEATRALDLAYRDVLAAFDAFIAKVPATRPIALAGHSQGAFHLRRLLRDRIAGTPLQDRIIAAYVVGWPVSVDHDLPLMGLGPCQRANQTGCVMSWLTVGEPADTEQLGKAYRRRKGLDGEFLGVPTPEGEMQNSAFLCSNPLTGTAGGEESARANLGTLVPDFESGEGTLEPGVVPAACGEDHFLHIGLPPDLDLGPYVLPGNNYHLYDVTLFWANLRADFERRTATWHKTTAPQSPEA